MIEEMLPPGVEAVSVTEDAPESGLFPGEADGLFPEEAEMVARAVPKRRAEFLTGRRCARRALGRLGLPPAPLTATERGAPQWPEGTVGSLTHCDGYRAVAVGWRRDVLTLGIDAEPNGPVPSGVLETIVVGQETDRLARLAAVRPQVHWDRLLFSAKESVYKAWHPLTGRWLGFEDAELDFTEAGGEGAGDGRAGDGGAGGGSWHGTFTARLLVPSHGAPSFFRGRWAARDGLVATAIAVRSA